MGIYPIMMTNQLLVHYVDQGSMAYFLSTPYSRLQISIIQASVFLTGLLLIMICTVIAGIIGSTIFLSADHQLNISQFISVNVVGFLLFFVVGGYCYLISSWLNDEKRALGLATIVTIIFYGLDFIGKMSEQVEWLRNLSIFSLFRAGELFRATSFDFGHSFLLLIIGFVGFLLSSFIFVKRDLSL
ncbi:ABC transporter permease subunit [Pontibacillus sp. HMF3514]|nr:ABC transporter permease subunit [Pontibacillus sp. HMF3514]